MAQKQQGQPQGEPQNTPEEPGSGEGAENPETPQTGAGIEDFEAWVDSQDEGVQQAYDVHLKKLKNALEQERKSTKQLAAQLRELQTSSASAEDLKKQITDLGTQLEVANQRAEFTTQVMEQRCNNLQLAWLAYQAEKDEYTNGKGQVDIAAFVAAYPQLFDKKGQPAPPPSGAGNGTGTQPQKNITMNDILRGRGREG